MRNFRAVGVANSLLTASTNAIAKEPLDNKAAALMAAYSGADRPGRAVGLFDREQAVLAKGYGMADLARAAPMRIDTQVKLGSAAKQFTALAILMPESDGLLSRQDEVRKHLPDLPVRYAGMTLDHLMPHTSGLADYLQLARISGAPSPAELTRGTALALVDRVPKRRASTVAHAGSVRVSADGA